MNDPKTAVQLIVFGQRAAADFPAVLSQIAAAGYDAFEAGNLYETVGEEEIRRLLAEHRLGVSGAHFGYGDYANSDRLDAHIAYATSLGVKHLMCSGVADSKSIDGYRESARLFNDIGKRLADHGLEFNYHNHAWEFDDLGGANGMEILSEETDPAFVKFNIDVFWVWYGGKDPAQFIRDHAERAGYFHFKDGRRAAGDDGKSRPIFAELGRGDVDLRSAIAAAREVNPSYIVAEQDSTQLAPEESISISRAYMRDALGLP